MEDMKDIYLTEEQSNLLKLYKEQKEHLLECIDLCFVAHLKNAEALHKKSENNEYYYGVYVAFNDARRIIRMYSEELTEDELS